MADSGRSWQPVMLPADVPRPVGPYTPAVRAGDLIFVSGQVGWNPETGEFETDDFAAQTAQALTNVATVLRAGGADTAQLVRMTWYVTDRDAYLAARSAIGNRRFSAWVSGVPAPSPHRLRFSRHRLYIN